MTEPGDVTALIERYRNGDRRAFDLLVERVYDELRAIARGHLRGRAPGGTLSATAVVNEAYLKLSATERAAWNDRSHFFAVAARVMRQILVDHARGRSRAKRGGEAQQVTLDDRLLAGEPTVAEQADHLLALDDALARLERVDERAVRVVECRYFVGLTEEETAKALDSSLRSVQRYWKTARTWIARELSPA